MLTRNVCLFLLLSLGVLPPGLFAEPGLNEPRLLEDTAPEAAVELPQDRAQDPSQTSSATPVQTEKEYILVVPTRHQDPDNQNDAIRLQIVEAPLPMHQLGETLGALREVLPEFKGNEIPTLAVYTSNHGFATPSEAAAVRAEQKQIMRGELREAFPDLAHEANVEIRNVNRPEHDSFGQRLDDPQLARKVVKRFALAKALTKGGIRSGSYVAAGTLTMDVTLLWKTVLVLGDSWVEYKSSMHATEIGNAFANGISVPIKNRILNRINESYKQNKNPYVRFARGAMMNLVVYAVGRNLLTQVVDAFAQPTVSHLPGLYDVGILALKGAGGVVAYTLAHVGFETARRKGILKLPRIEMYKRMIGLPDPVSDFLNASPKLRDWSKVIQYPQWALEALIPLVAAYLPARHRIVLIETSVQSDPRNGKDVQDLEYLEVTRAASLDPESIREAIGRRDIDGHPIPADQAVNAGGYAIDKEITTHHPTCPERLLRTSWRSRIWRIVIRYPKRQ